MKNLVPVVAVAVGLTACASINSVETSKSDVGLKYFMPMKDAMVNVTVGADSKISEIKIGTTVAYPDLSRAYVLKYERNLVGKNTLDIAIAEKGLLTSAKSTTVSGLTEALKNAAMSFAQTSAKALKEVTAHSPCATGTYTFTYRVDDTTEKIACGVNITVEKLGGKRTSGHGITSETQNAGIFYRQSEPYLVTATGGGQATSAIVFSPSLAPAQFLPITRSFFTGSDATLTFEDGMPKGYKQESDGELVALLKLPADVLSAYFSALGSTFENFKSTDEKQAAALSADVKLELAKRKYDACIKAIQANDSSLVKQLEC